MLQCFLKNSAEKFAQWSQKFRVTDNKEHSNCKYHFPLERFLDICLLDFLSLFSCCRLGRIWFFKSWRARAIPSISHGEGQERKIQHMQYFLLQQGSEQHSRCISVLCYKGYSRVVNHALYLWCFPVVGFFFRRTWRPYRVCRLRTG